MKSCKFLSFLVFIILSFCLSAFAQNVENKEQTFEEKQAEAEVRKFVKTFVEEIDNKRDLNLISPSYFINDYKKKIQIPEKLKNKPSKELERVVAQCEAEIFNSLFLFIFNLTSNNTLFNPETDLSFDKILLLLFTKKSATNLKKSQIFELIVEEHLGELEENYFTDIVQIRKTLAELKEINTLLRAETAKKLPKIQASYTKNISKLRELVDYYSSYYCEETSCEGLPPKTMLYHYDLFPFCFSIIKENGVYKIREIRLGLGN